MSQKKILVTGAAGFIGFHLVKALVNQGKIVLGIDNINDYYDSNLKFDRLTELGINKSDVSWFDEVHSNKYSNFCFIRLNLEDTNELFKVCEKWQFDYIIHLAAQAGVRYSLENPFAYIQSNLVGFGNILEVSRVFKIKHLIYASLSSVYGMNKKIPFSTFDNVDHPISLYAATKKSNELMAYSYSHLYQIPSTGLRFFTVYGPWGRPDMAYFEFTKKIVSGEDIKVFNNGEMKRDFTYVSDIINGILEVIKSLPESILSQSNQNSHSIAPYRILNLGNNKPIMLLDFIKIIEDALSKKAKIKFEKLQPGDVLETWADISQTQKEINFYPETDISTGLILFVNWYKAYYNV